MKNKKIIILLLLTVSLMINANTRVIAEGDRDDDSIHTVIGTAQDDTDSEAIETDTSEGSEDSDEADESGKPDVIENSDKTDTRDTTMPGSNTDNTEEKLGWYNSHVRTQDEITPEIETSDQNKIVPPSENDNKYYQAEINEQLSKGINIIFVSVQKNAEGELESSEPQVIGGSMFLVFLIVWMTLSFCVMAVLIYVTANMLNKER